MLDAAYTCNQRQAERGGVLDGFLPCLLDMKGFALAVFIYYGFSSMGCTHENANHIAKLGNVLTAIHLPWLVL
eukprot:3349586-Pyramimonas_sp.AAC.1